MKKGIIIALCSIAIALAGCKKPIDYANDYVGNYTGKFTLTLTSMNHQPQSNLSFPIDNVAMDIAKGSAINTVTATVTMENETHQTQGTATEEKLDFGTVHLDIDKPDQLYKFNLDLKMEGYKAQSDSLNLTGSFTGTGRATFMGQEQVFNEVSGTINGILIKQ